MTLGVLSKEETRHIQLLMERKNSLEELILILNNPVDYELLDRVKTDLQEIEGKISIWWDEVLIKYDRTINDGFHYSINFFTCELTASD